MKMLVSPHHMLAEGHSSQVTYVDNMKEYKSCVHIFLNSLDQYQYSIV